MEIEKEFKGNMKKYKIEFVFTKGGYKSYVGVSSPVIEKGFVIVTDPDGDQIFVNKDSIQTIVVYEYKGQ